MALRQPEGAFVGPLLLFAGIAGLVVAVFLVEAVIRRPVVAAAIITTDLVLRYSDVPLPSLPLGSVSVYDHDIVFALIGTAAIARLLRKHWFTWAQRSLLLAGAILLFSLARGVAAFGVETAVNESRHWLFLVIAALYFTTVVSRRVLHRVGFVIVCGGGALAAVAVLRWVIVGAGGPEALLGSRADAGLRVLHAEVTLIVLQAFFILAVAFQRLNTWLRWLAAGLLTTVILMQHRTIWVALVVGLLVMLYRDRDLARRAVVLIAGALLATALVVISLFGNPADEVATTATRTDTFEWRFEGWQELITTRGPQNAVEVASGQGFGAGWAREVANRPTRDVSPHSMYVESLLRLGLIGTGALLVALWGPLLALWRRPSDAREAGDAPQQIPWLSNDAIAVLLAAQAAFSVTYFPAPTAGIVIGVAGGMVGQRLALSRRVLSSQRPSPGLSRPATPGRPIRSRVPIGGR